MKFLNKHSNINNLFGELGWAVANLDDSSAYDARFLEIADEVQELNEAGYSESENDRMGRKMMGLLRSLVDHETWISYAEPKKKPSKYKACLSRGKIIGLTVILSLLISALVIGLDGDWSTSTSMTPFFCIALVLCGLGLFAIIFYPYERYPWDQY